jgi:hypothetical protein
VKMAVAIRLVMFMMCSFGLIMVVLVELW